MEERVKGIAAELLAVLGTGRQIAPVSARYPDFGLSEAYDVTERVREERWARGERPVGRKIGFTNTAVWSGYGISGPIWNYVFSGTVHELSSVSNAFAIAGFSEPRIEPEIVLHLARAPLPDMGEDELMDCVDWVAHGFELVHSVYPGWVFTAPDAVAAFGLHGGLFLGERHDIAKDRAGWKAALAGFTIELRRNGATVADGHARDVLGGPLTALRFLVAELARYPRSVPLAAGEIVTTGTLTSAQPAAAGETWSTDLTAVPIRGIELRFD